MGKIFSAIAGAVMIAAGIILMPISPVVGVNLIIAGVSTIGSVLLMPKARPRPAQEANVKIGEAPATAAIGGLRRPI